MGRVALPDKRTQVLFSRVTETNKMFVSNMAEKKGVSESMYVDYLLTRFRKQSDSIKRKSGGGS